MYISARKNLCFLTLGFAMVACGISEDAENGEKYTSYQDSSSSSSRGIMGGTRCEDLESAVPTGYAMIGCVDSYKENVLYPYSGIPISCVKADAPHKMMLNTTDNQLKFTYDINTYTPNMSTAGMVDLVFNPQDQMPQDPWSQYFAWGPPANMITHHAVWSINASGNGNYGSTAVNIYGKLNPQSSVYISQMFFGGNQGSAQSNSVMALLQKVCTPQRHNELLGQANSLLDQLRGLRAIYRSLIEQRRIAADDKDEDLVKYLDSRIVDVSSQMQTLIRDEIDPIFKALAEECCDQMALD